MKLPFIIVLVFFISFNLSAQIQWIQSGNEMTGEGNEEWFGASSCMSADGTTIISGAYLNDALAFNGGRVSVYQYDGVSWQKHGQDIFGSGSSENVGWAVSTNANGTLIAVGAVGTSAYTGKVDVYQYVSGAWVQKGNSIAGDSPGDHCGNAVSMSADGLTLIVGSNYDATYGTSSGNARVFRFNGATWNQLGSTFCGSAAYDFLGCSVSINADGSIVAIGAKNADPWGSSSGQVTVFQYQSGGYWTQMGAAIHGDTTNNVAGTGVSLDASGLILAVGSPGNSAAGSSAGQVKVYEYVGSQWQLKGNPMYGDVAQDRFGESVKLSGDGNSLIAGAVNNDFTGTNAGHAKVYHYNSGVWELTGSAICGEGDGDMAGISVGINYDASLVAVGARANDNLYTDAGHVRAFYPCHETVGADTVNTCNFSYTWINGITYYDDVDTAVYITQNVAGCDSVVTLHLRINSTSNTDVRSACDSLTWIDGITYQESTTTPQFTLTNVAGCDSLITLHLTILKDSVTDVRSACDSFTWIDGITYTQSTNTPKWTLVNSAGCDSVISLNLTMHNSVTKVDSQTVCDSLIWVDGVHYYASTSTPSFMLTTAHGCDSLVTLNLTVKNSSHLTDFHAACDSFIWMDGNAYFQDNDTARFFLTNAAGCDSVITLSLDILSDHVTDIVTACDTFTWIDGITYTSSNNTAVYQITNLAGCDSIVSLDLTINHSSLVEDVHFSCEPFTWMDGNTYTSSNNTAVYILQTTDGCDSIIALDLTLYPADVMQHPVNQYVAIDSAARFVVSTLASPAFFQWQGDLGFGFADLTEGGQYTGTFNDTLIVSNVSMSNDNQSFRCIVHSLTCSDTSMAAVLYASGVGISENMNNGVIRVFPNPAANVISVELPAEFHADRYSIMDKAGKVVLHGSWQDVSSCIDVSLLTDGSYVLRIEGVENMVESVFLKQNE
ncbi:MAG: T9SS type A sorting domain-containing protein [Bacteroidales bacterium]